MGSGKRPVCCCDSITWCDFIKWAYIICGMVFVLSIALLLYRKQAAEKPSPSGNYHGIRSAALPGRGYDDYSGYYTTQGYGYGSTGGGGGGGTGNPGNPLEADKEKQFYYNITKSGISGLFCVVMGALVWFGASNRSSMCLLCYIIIQLVVCAFSIVSLLGGIIVHDNSAGAYELTAFPAVFLALLFVWVVDIQRKEFALEQPQLPMYQQDPQQMQQWPPGPPGQPWQSQEPYQEQQQEQSDSDQPSQKKHHKKHHHSKKEPLEASSNNPV